MALLTARLLEVLQIGETIAGVFDLPEKSRPTLGQYLPAQNLERQPEGLTHPLFTLIGPAERHPLGPIPSHWVPGDRIACLPPQGKGFKLPSAARRVALLSFNGNPIRTLPLLAQALAQSGAVALFFQERPHPDILDAVPTSVEINPLKDLKENLDWPDFLAAELSRQELPALWSFLGEAAPPFTGQVLVKTPMPCRGLGACGVCAVRTQRGWRNACEDGPVFSLQELLHVAG